MGKKKLAFVDHNFHKKTKSGDFLREIFKEQYIIKDIWWSSRKENELIDQLKDFENIFFFQSLIPFYDLIKLKNKNLMWAPMYDNLPLNNIYWKKIIFSNIKILSFSKKINFQAKKFGCDFLKLKYFIKPKNYKIQKKIKKVNFFFWYRGGIKLTDWLNSIDSNIVKKIIYLDIPDPGKKSEIIEEKIIKKYKIKKVLNNQILNKKRYIEYVKRCDVFITPRKQEGIGMSLVEAISMNKYLFAYNDATMNEYIVNKKIGLLFNKKKITQFKLRNLNNNFNYRKKYADLGYKNWHVDKNKIIVFFQRKTKFNKVNSLIVKLYILIDYYKYLIKNIYN